jgi:hypothetical protein
MIEESMHRPVRILIVGISSNRGGIDANFSDNSSKMADSFSASHFCFMHDFLEMQGSQL